MLDGLNKYGLPVKYGIVGFIAGIGGALLSDLMGYGGGLGIYIQTPVAAGVGGAIGGWLRQRKGKKS